MESRKNCVRKSKSSMHNKEELNNLDDRAAEVVLDLETFVKQNYFDTIGILNKENYSFLQRPLIVAFHAFKNNFSLLRKWLDLLEELALRYKSINFLIADVEDSQLFHWDMSYLEEEYGEKFNPCIFAVDTKDRQFNFVGSVCSAPKKTPTNRQLKLKGKAHKSVKDFCKNLLKDKLLYSEPIPQEVETSKSAVKEAVGYTFQALVEDVEKDVLLTVYANWCRGVGDLLSVLDELSILLLKDAENLTIVKIKSHPNYIPLKYEIRSLPFIVYIPHNNKKNRAIYKNPSWTVENLMEFIEKNATFELKKKIEPNGSGKGESNM